MNTRTKSKTKTVLNFDSLDLGQNVPRLVAFNLTVILIPPTGRKGVILVGLSNPS